MSDIEPIDTKALQLQELDNFMWACGYYRIDTKYFAFVQNSKANTVPLNNAVRLYNSESCNYDIADAYGINPVQLLHAHRCGRFHSLKLGTTRHGKEIVCFSNWLKTALPISEEDAEEYLMWLTEND